jgi:hypothetical protein
MEGVAVYPGLLTDETWGKGWMKGGLIEWGIVGVGVCSGASPKVSKQR